MNLSIETTPIADRPSIDWERLAERRSVAVDAGLREALVAPGAAAENLGRLVSGDALCITTGQQPGLLTGPLFTVYKALTAIALARSLGTRLTRHVVPVFWVAGDDHDFAEANHLHLVTAGNDVVQVTLRQRDPSSPLVPLYKEPLGDAIDAVTDALTQHTPDTEFRADILAWVARHYHPDANFADAFAGALAELLGPAGLIVLRPTHPNVKRAMAPWLMSALRQAADLDQSLERRAAELRQRGRAVPVPVGDGATTVMLEGRLGRDRLMQDGDHFVTRRSGETWSLAELQEIAASEPSRLSPNVLLRPVVEAALLPSLAYVAGPGELSYLAQCAPIYEALAVEPQAAFPRWSGRVVEQRIAKVLTKYGVGAADLHAQPGALEASLVRDDMPEDASDALNTLRSTLKAEYDRLQDAATQVDPTLRKTVQSARNAALSGTDDIERRLIAHLKKQNEIVVQQIAKARQHLFPTGKPQERVLNIVPYLVRYGAGVVDHLLETVQASLASRADG